MLICIWFRRRVLLTPPDWLTPRAPLLPKTILAPRLVKVSSSTARIWLGNAWPLSNLTIPKLWLTENLLWIQFIPILINNTRSAHFWPGTRVTSDCSVEPLSRQQQLDTCVLQQSLGNCCQSDSLGQCHAARTGLHSPWQVVRWHRKYVDIDRSLCVSTYLPLPRS